MATSLSTVLKQTLADKLAESLASAVPDLTPRRTFGSVHFPGKATTIMGIRRAGKTTFLHQCRRERMEQKIPQEALPYLNFEDERLGDLRAEHLGFLVEEYRRRLPDVQAQTTVTWCFDEIQVVSGWERFVRRLMDEGGCEVFVTGSSAALLSREIATALRGRAWPVPLYPFSFTEAMRHGNRAIPSDPSFLQAAERSRIEHAFMEWLRVGGFPEAQGLDDVSRYQLLRDYVDVAILRDVVERHGVSNITALRWLVRHLLGNAAGLFSVGRFYGSLRSQGVAISKDTLHQLVSHLEDCFLVRLVWMESRSERQRMVNPRKVYPVDPGLIPVFDATGQASPGRSLETAVLIELERRGYAVHYVRTPGGFEVDFLARRGDDRPALIQVCADASDAATAEREVRALTDAGDHFPEASRLFLTLTRDGAPAEAPRGIDIQPAYEWIIRGMRDKDER